MTRTLRLQAAGTRHRARSALNSVGISPSCRCASVGSVCLSLCLPLRPATNRPQSPLSPPSIARTRRQPFGRLINQRPQAQVKQRSSPDALLHRPGVVHTSCSAPPPLLRLSSSSSSSSTCTITTAKSPCTWNRPSSLPPSSALRRRFVFDPPSPLDIRPLTPPSLVTRHPSIACPPLRYPLNNPHRTYKVVPLS